MHLHKESIALQAYGLGATWHSTRRDGLSQQACQRGSLKFGLPHLAVGLQRIIPQIGDNASGVRCGNVSLARLIMADLRAGGDEGKAGRNG